MAFTDIIFYILLPVVAFLYASVGHGGASGYLALMAIFSFAPDVMKPTALLLNMAVSLMAFFQYYRKGHFQWKLFWPFALGSVPAAFLGGTIVIDELVYKRILGVLLLLSVIRLVGFGQQGGTPQRSPALWMAAIIGVIIGLLSGMIGIGGGIILSPIILLLQWADMKKTAAVSALFIFVNSIAGFAGLMTYDVQISKEMIWMICIAFAGGTAGAFFGAAKWHHRQLTWILAIVLVIASVKLLLT